MTDPDNYERHFGVIPSHIPKQEASVQNLVMFQVKISKSELQSMLAIPQIKWLLWQIKRGQVEEVKKKVDARTDDTMIMEIYSLREAHLKSGRSLEAGETSP